MDDGSIQHAVQLFLAGSTARDEGPRAIGFGRTDLLHQIFADGDAELVEIFLITEASSHPAALDRGSDNIEAGGL